MLLPSFNCFGLFVGTENLWHAPLSKKPTPNSAPPQTPAPFVPSSIEVVAGDSKSVNIELENTGSLNLGEVSWALEGSAKGWASIR